MSRRSNRSYHVANERKRVANDNTNRRLRFYEYKNKYFQDNDYNKRRDDLLRYEDRRQWHPEGNLAPARSFSYTRHRLKAVTRAHIAEPYKGPFTEQQFEEVPMRIGFRKPSGVLVCVRRKIRRAVLFANRDAGVNGQRKRRLTEYSDVRC